MDINTTRVFSVVVVLTGFAAFASEGRETAALE